MSSENTAKAAGPARDTASPAAQVPPRRPAPTPQGAKAQMTPRMWWSVGLPVADTARTWLDDTPDWHPL